jgi:hypothetical protein
VRTLESFGYTYRGGEWLAPASVTAAPLPLTAEADAMHGCACGMQTPLPDAWKARSKMPSSTRSSTSSKPTKSSAGSWVRSLAARVRLVLSTFPGPRVRLQIGNDRRSTRKADNLRVTLCAGT